MLDCGVNVASNSPEDSFPYLFAPEFRIEEIDAVIVSHAHLDHSGFIPYLFKYGYEGAVYCTPPTRDLMALLQLDYIDVAQREGKPIPYSSKDIKKAMKHVITLDYEEVSDISPNIKITFYPAGHILGSSITHIHVGEGLHNIVYTGDFKFERTVLMEAAKFNFPRVETLITESTYGGKDDIQPRRDVARRELIKFVKKVIERGGKIIIPVFAVGRAQELMVILEEAIEQGELERFPIYLDGMIWEATAIHTTYPEYLNKNLQNKIFHEDHNPFLSDIFVRVGNHEERMEVIEGEPSIVLATSGMLVGGPAIEYFKRLAPDEKNAIIFVGYQAEGSLGRRIQKGWKEIPLPGEDGRSNVVKVNMDIMTAGFSGHSDRNQLLTYIHYLNPKPKRVIVNHGDSIKTVQLASAIHKMFRVETKAPYNLETVRLR